MSYVKKAIFRYQGFPIFPARIMFGYSMIFRKYISFLVVVITSFFSGCVTSSYTAASHQKSSDELISLYLNHAKKNLQSGDQLSFASDIERTLYQPNAVPSVNAYFSENPVARKAFKDFQIRRFSDVSQPQEANLKYSNLMSLADGVFTPVEVSEFSNLLQQTVKNGNLNGSIPFNFGDVLDNFPFLKQSPHIDLITERTLQILTSKSSDNRPVPQLMDYIGNNGGADSILGKKVALLLPSMNVKKQELDSIGKIYPAFVEKRFAQTSIRTFVQFKNADRLLSDDISSLLKKRLKGVQWVQSPDANTLTINIERIRNNESVLPERVQTVTYGFFDVNIVYASLYMPKNASYLYDIVTGGAKIEYGYEVTAFKGNKKIFDDVVRGSVGGESSSCRNQRIQNVFGGVSPADFIANDDMQRRCATTVAASIDALRRDVLDKVVESVASIDEVKVIQNIN